jgi:hypothetical protein
VDNVELEILEAIHELMVAIHSLKRFVSMSFNIFNSEVDDFPDFRICCGVSIATSIATVSVDQSALTIKNIFSLAVFHPFEIPAQVVIHSSQTNAATSDLNTPKTKQVCFPLNENKFNHLVIRQKDNLLIELQNLFVKALKF